MKNLNLEASELFRNHSHRVVIDAFNLESSQQFVKFSKIATNANIFIYPNITNEVRAQKVASKWLTFSTLMPEILKNCADNISIQTQKDTFISIANEELGCDGNNKAHSCLFEESCLKIGLNPKFSVDSNLLSLVNFSQNEQESKLMGLSFGLEIIANENIEFLFSAICFDASKIYLLDNSLFFKIHRTNEDEHITKTFNNFIQFCNTKEEIENFEYGFKFAVNFWKIFWSSTVIGVN